MLSPRIGGWGAEGGGGFDIYSDSSPLVYVSSPFFVTITYIEEIERFFFSVGSFYLQSYTKQTVRNCWTLHCLCTIPSLCWCRRFDKLTVITTLRGRRDSPDAVNKKHSVEVS